MSHFTVGVLVDKNGKDLKELLAPYQENNMGDCPLEYLEFFECDEDCIKEYEEHKDDYETLDEFMESYHGYEKNKETGTYGYWENPNAKWDWYVVGGRWSNSLTLRDGSTCNNALLKDIDWEKIQEKLRTNAEKFWDSNPQGINRLFSGITEKDTRESYVSRESNFSTYAVITPDGEWHSKGEMGWFGISSESEDEANSWTHSFYDKFIKDSDPELELVIVDCHI